jgi:hypothetical protein
MFECNNLVHPFQTDPGTSQRQRIMDDLLSGMAKIDGRNIADLLDYFVQLSRHINYYNTDLSIGDWQPFFQKSIPFSLAAIIKYNRNSIDEKVSRYGKVFDRKPSKAGLQLLIHYLFHQVIQQINNWHLQLKGSGLPAELVIEKLIKDKLRDPLLKFICYHNTAVRWYCVKPVSFLRLLENDAWRLDATKLNPDIDTNCKPEGKKRRKKLISLRNKVRNLFPSFLDVVRILAGTAEQSIEQSFFPLKEEFREKHPPHLALLFAFLKLFQHLQGDLNKYTKKHLDFFYKQVLQLKPRPAIPDKVHLVFEIQKQLNSYLLKKGLLAKDGKDNNKAEVLFALDDEIVVNKTQVAEQRTLFLNNQNIGSSKYIEGVYMAPDATKADGVEKEFKGEPKSFPTVGSKFSKYTNPEKTFAQPYPNGRLGFVLASPVLLLNEGKRTIEITLACRLRDNLCDEIQDTEPVASQNCCEENIPGTPGNVSTNDKPYSSFIDASKFYNDVKTALQETYYYVSEDLIREAAKNGISKALEEMLRKLLIKKTKLCYCESDIKNYDRILKKVDWVNEILNVASAAEKIMLADLFKPRKALRVLFSGEKEWIDPAQPTTITISPAPLAGNTFLLKILAVLGPDRPAITFFDKEKLKEDLNTTLPLAKIELDDKVKLIFTDNELRDKIYQEDDDDCCLLRESSTDAHFISLYHFFRNVFVMDIAGGETTRIDVSVCGLKNLIVQNDESLQDVNRPIYPFGTRPRVGASFYIGSKELLLKNWQELYVNAEWKDKPADFGVHYKHYSYKDTIFEDGSKEIVNSSFLTSAFVLDRGLWTPDAQRRLFKEIPGEQVRVKPLPPGFPPVPTKVEVPAAFCLHGSLPNNVDVYDYTVGAFPGLSAYERRQDLLLPLEPFNVSSQFGFIRFTLDGVSFQHDIFPFVLTRQLMAYAGLLSLDIIQEMVTKANDANLIIDAMIVKIDDIHFQIGQIEVRLGDITGDINLISSELGLLETNLDDAKTALTGGIPNIPLAIILINNALTRVITINTGLMSLSGGQDDIETAVSFIKPALNDNPAGPFDPNNAANYGLKPLASELKTIIQFFVDNLQVDPELKDGLPSEPYTPVIKSISIDYRAIARINDIDLIHLYPYKDTYKHEELELQPTLFPVFCDEGTLFIGLKELIPASNLKVLFQLAEATADSESAREEISWHYLDNNQWKKLRNGFEVLDDAIDGLTTSGIVKFSLPENMTKDNTILPKDLHWIKASIPKNSKTVSETIALHTQAIRASFTNDTLNDKLRLSKPLDANAISKLNEADTNVKKLIQPYGSFGGRVPEEEGHIYVRVSELLRHKGRAIQKFDYERLALEAFPQLFKTKCINHSFALNAHEYINDFPIAPGYVLLAVIPDLNQLSAAQSFEPRVPVSMLDDIQEYFKKRTSPFVRFRAMNPRYERIQLCLKVKLYLGKDENYYKEKLKQDLKEFLAPWAIGQYDKLTFGQCVSRSEIIRFLETRDYIDYILDLKMKHELPGSLTEFEKVCPKTPRSILIAGDIDVCIMSQDCEQWQKCYDAQGKPIACCENEKIPVADYCPDIIIE